MVLDMSPHYRTLLITTFNFSNKSKSTNIITLHEKHKIIKNRNISHTFKKCFTYFSKTLKLKKNHLPFRTSVETLKSPIYQKNAEAF